jgi:L-aspartate oxidase
MEPARETDYLVIGSGIAGLTFALETARHGRTLILTKKDRAESNSNYAQGGIAGVMAEDDDIRFHIEDTLVAGAGLCHLEAVEVLVREGPRRIQELIDLGARFSMEHDAEGTQRLSLGREGGHSRNRIVHAVDRTGWEMERTLLAATRDCPNLEILEHFFVVDLAVVPGPDGPLCFGAWVLDTATGSLELVAARAVLLATGGCGRVYKHTTNPNIATGDGVAMASRAGATIANMEFIQFHPTALYHPEGRSFLISEAVRGEGGILRTLDGDTFMERYHPLGALAPRDIVARAIHAERLKHGHPCVHLDVTHLDPEYLRGRFPTIFERCASLGIDITKHTIPVVPAAHYMCGGVLTDLEGCTSITNLYAAGEVTCTGVHGANRLASNSLLEAMVFGQRAAEAAVGQEGVRPLRQDVPRPLSGDADPAEAREEAKHYRERLHEVMNDYVGIVRNNEDLVRAEEMVAEIAEEAEEICASARPDPDLYELRNMSAVAGLVVRCARARRESRGLHYTTDYPNLDPNELRDTIVSQTGTTP